MLWRIATGVISFVLVTSTHLSGQIYQNETLATSTDSTVTELRRRLDALSRIEIPPIRHSVSGGGYYTPVAFGSSWGFAGIGAGYQKRARHSTNPDGALGASLGLGNPWKIGLDVGVAILDLTSTRPDDGGFGHRGSFSFKIHHALSRRVAVAGGMENILNWGGTDVPPTAYGVASMRLHLKHSSKEPFSRAMVSLGVGSGRFRSERALWSGGSPVGVFASVSVNVVPSASTFVEWTGQDVTAGATLLPIRKLPLFVSPGVTDLTGHAGDGPRLVLGVGFGFTLR